MHIRLGSATLSQLAFSGEGNPNFSWERSHWDNTVVKSKKQNKQNKKQTKKQTNSGQLELSSSPVGRTLIPLAERVTHFTDHCIDRGLTDDRGKCIDMGSSSSVEWPASTFLRLWHCGAAQDERELVSWSVGALSPVNYKGLYQDRGRLVSWCFKPSQLQRTISRLREISQLVL